MHEKQLFCPEIIRKKLDFVQFLHFFFDLVDKLEKYL